MHGNKVPKQLFGMILVHWADNLNDQTAPKIVKVVKIAIMHMHCDTCLGLSRALVGKSEKNGAEPIRFSYWYCCLKVSNLVPWQVASTGRSPWSPWLVV